MTTMLDIVAYQDIYRCRYVSHTVKVAEVYVKDEFTEAMKVNDKIFHYWIYEILYFSVAFFMGWVIMMCLVSCVLCCKVQGLASV